MRTRRRRPRGALSLTRYPGLGLGAGASFSPLSLSPTVWLKADGTLWQDSARTTAATLDGDPVGAWDDASGLSNHLLQATAGKRPTLKLSIQNGLPVVRADGVDDFLQSALFAAALTPPYTVFLAAKTTALGTSPAFYDGGADVQALFDSDGANWRMITSSGLLGAAADTSWHQHTDLWVSSGTKLRTDGAQTTGNEPANNLTRLTLGSRGSGTSHFLAGDIGEIVVCPGNQTANFAAMEAYLKGRWATP